MKKFLRNFFEIGTELILVVILIFILGFSFLLTKNLNPIPQETKSDKTVLGANTVNNSGGVEWMPFLYSDLNNNYSLTTTQQDSSKISLDFKINKFSDNELVKDIMQIKNNSNKSIKINFVGTIPAVNKKDMTYTAFVDNNEYIIYDAHNNLGQPSYNIEIPPNKETIVRIKLTSSTTTIKQLDLKFDFRMI